MNPLQAVILAIFGIIDFVCLDFPGAKIAFTGVVIVILFNFLYKRIISNNLSVKRTMDTWELFNSMPEMVTITVKDNSLLPLYAAEIVDDSDINISALTRHHYLLSVNGMSENSFSYQLTGRKRGKYRLGPTTVKLEDLLGLFAVSLELETYRDVIVYPNIYWIANLTYKSIQPQGGVRSAVPIFEDPSMVNGLRNYQFGDDLRKINWKSSAKLNKYMVNTYQPSISVASVVVLNLFEEDFDFRKNDPYKEKGIEIAASLIRLLYMKRQEIALASNFRIDDNDVLYYSASSKNEIHYSMLLRNLAVCTTGRSHSFEKVLNPGLLDLSWGTSLFVITTRINNDCVTMLIDFQKSGHDITLINIGPKTREDLDFRRIGVHSYYAEITEGIINLRKM